MSPLTQLTSLNGPVPMAVVLPKVAGSLEAQTIDEKLSARNGMKAPKRLAMSTRKVRSSMISTVSIGPHAIWVRLALSGSKARSMVNLTSWDVNGVPSWQRMPSLSVKV